MEISKETLLKLKCSECNCFLSRIPIYSKEDGSVVCGRCPPPTETAEQTPKYVRNTTYENLIVHAKFPCMYQSRGCKKQLVTSPRDAPHCLTLQNHEENCKFRPIVCSTVLRLPVGTCDWIGCKNKFYEHCKLQHPEHILTEREHPCVFKYELTKDCAKSYVIELFDDLYLIHTKVCMNTHKIYHNVHCFDKTPGMDNVYFELVVKRGHVRLIKEGKIEDIGCNNAMKENLSLACGINSLIEIFDVLADTTFTIEIMCTTDTDFCRYCNEGQDATSSDVDLIKYESCRRCYDCFESDDEYFDEMKYTY